MTSVPEQRRWQIIEWLKDDQILRIDELAQRLNVSLMTIHRDVDTLVEMQLVEKVHGGVRLPDVFKVTTELCYMCHMPIKPRLQFNLTGADGQNCSACCAHCGLMLLQMNPQLQVALLRDFLYSRVVNVRQAYFVVASRIALCCEPSVLAFANIADASDFQRGFSGQVYDYAQAIQHLMMLHQS